MAKTIAESWLSRAWTLTLFLIVLATALLLGDQIKAATWSTIVTLAAGAFYGINAIEKWRAPP